MNDLLQSLGKERTIFERSFDFVETKQSLYLSFVESKIQVDNTRIDIFKEQIQSLELEKSQQEATLASLHKELQETPSSNLHQSILEEISSLSKETESLQTSMNVDCNVICSGLVEMNEQLLAAENELDTWKEKQKELQEILQDCEEDEDVRHKRVSYLLLRWRVKEFDSKN